MAITICGGVAYCDVVCRSCGAFVAFVRCVDSFDVEPHCNGGCASMDVNEVTTEACESDDIDF